MLVRVTGPAVTPVSLTEAKLHCRVDGTDDDVMLQLYLDAAVSHIDGAEGILGRCIVTQTWDYSIIGTLPDEIAVPLPNLQSVTSVKYYDTSGVQQTWSSGNYTVTGQFIAPVSAWPDYDPTRPVTVRYVAGYGVAADVPSAIKAAILLFVGDLYSQREGSAEFGNRAARALLLPYKHWRF